MKHLKIDLFSDGRVHDLWQTLLHVSLTQHHFPRKKMKVSATSDSDN